MKKKKEEKGKKGGGVVCCRCRLFPGSGGKEGALGTLSFMVLGGKKKRKKKKGLLGNAGASSRSGARNEKDARFAA